MPWSEKNGLFHIGKWFNLSYRGITLFIYQQIITFIIHQSILWWSTNHYFNYQLIITFIINQSILYIFINQQVPLWKWNTHNLQRNKFGLPNVISKSNEKYVNYIFHYMNNPAPYHEQCICFFFYLTVLCYTYNSK